MSLLLLLKEVKGEAPSPDVVSRWELDETSGTTAVDSVGSNDGTYTSAELGKPSIIPYIPEAVTALLGENAYITVPDDESLHFTEGLSLRLWYEVVDTGVLFARNGNYTLSLTGEGKLTFAFRDPAGEWHEASTEEGALGVGKHSIEVTYDRSYIRIYIDGGEAGSAAATAKLRGSEGEVWIGVQPGGEFQFCHGRYQRIELRSGPRSAAEILATYEEESVEKWLDFNGDFETGDFSQFWEVQANEKRATVVEAPLGKGKYAAHFEVQEGDPEVVGPGGNRAEAIPDRFFWDGDFAYFRGLTKLLQVDWPHWTIPFQLHDEGTGSPPVCGFLIEDEGSKRFRIQKGDSSAVYFDVPVAEGETFEWSLFVAFGAEGSLRLRINGELIGEVTGIDTVGAEPCNFKAGIYRSKDSKGTTELLHDGILISEEFFSEPPIPNPEPGPGLYVQVEGELVAL